MKVVAQYCKKHYRNNATVRLALFNGAADNDHDYDDHDDDDHDDVAAATDRIADIATGHHLAVRSHTIRNRCVLVDLVREPHDRTAIHDRVPGVRSACHPR